MTRRPDRGGLTRVHCARFGPGPVGLCGAAHPGRVTSWDPKRWLDVRDDACLNADHRGWGVDALAYGEGMTGVRGQGKQARLDPLLGAVDAVVVEHPWSADQIASIRKFRSQEASRWRSAGDHEVEVRWTSWAFLQESPWAQSWRTIRNTGSDRLVSRHELVELARDCRRADTWVPLLLATYAWGMGSTGYGPARLTSILQRPLNDPRLVLELDDTLREAVRSLDTDPLRAYAYLRGQQTKEYGTASGTRRVPGWGPAFFTKFLHFASESLEPAKGRALILDKRVADALRRLTRDALDLKRWSEETPARTAATNTGEIARRAWAEGNWWTGRYRTYLNYVQARHHQVIREISDWPNDPGVLEVALWKGYPHDSQTGNA